MQNDKLKILAVDDTLDNLITLKAVIEDAFQNARFLSASNGKQCMELALNEDPDVVLLDIVMPGMDGFEVCRKLKADERLSHIPVIFLTALQTGRESRIKALEAGGEAFLAKPLEETELIAQIRAMAKIKAAAVAQQLEKESLADLVAERTRELHVELSVRRSMEIELKNSIAALKAVRPISDDSSRDSASPENNIPAKHAAPGILNESWIYGEHGQLNSGMFEREQASLRNIGNGNGETLAQLESSEDELKLAVLVYQDSSEAMMVTDENNDILTVNRAFTEITGYEPADVIGMNPSLLQSGRHDESFYAEMWEQIKSSGRWKGELWNKKKNGGLFAAQLTINVIRKEDGSPRRYVGLLSDITDKKLSSDLIWYEANFDALTGLPNRRLFRDHLQQEIRKSRRSGLPLALMFLDLDEFKDVNDTLGHDMGDLLLKEAAERLKGCVRETDTVARLGGDEFTVIVADLADISHVDTIAQNILHRLYEPFQLRSEIAHVSASIGITLFPNDAVEIEDLIKNADQAMYAAKQEGKNRYHYFTSAMQQNAIARMRLINDLRGALDGAQFDIVYQPIVELSSGAINKAEALIRWRHPSRGLVNPIDFIHVAEETGMISSIGDWIFHEVAAQVALWRLNFHPDFQVSINVSPVHFKKEGVGMSAWMSRLRELDVPGHGIVIEITEGLLLDASAKVTNQLLMLRDAGIEVALDDFGTGYSSLSYLKKFDIDYVKIDQAFVRDLESDNSDLALCEAIIVMAHKLGIKVIAEGVETLRQYELLITAGCNFAQGYLFSKPVPAHQFEELLQSGNFSPKTFLSI